MNQPAVCAVMLTADRPELARRAVECFRRQTYPAKRLLIWDAGREVYPELGNESDDVYWIAAPGPPAMRTIGALRNGAVALWTEFPILIHWDDDDWSHFNRIAEQVALLQSSGADCVGYREMLFWRESKRICDDRAYDIPGEAWLYSNPNPGYCLGTSLCYWRRTWQRKPFVATNVGEDPRFCTGLKCVGRSSVEGYAPGSVAEAEPRMIARIHAGNTSTAYEPAKLARASEWKRVPEWDQHCRSVME